MAQVLKIEVSGVGDDADALTGRKAAGVYVAFNGGTHRFVSWKSFKSLICYELYQAKHAEVKPDAPVAQVRPANNVAAKV